MIDRQTAKVLEVHESLLDLSLVLTQGLIKYTSSIGILILVNSGC